MPRAVIGAVLCLTVGAAPARTQRRSVLLQVLPAPGDAFRMRLDQHVEMSGTSRVDGADSTVSVASAAHVLSHARVERRDASRGTIIVAVTDSVSIVSSDGEVMSSAEDTRRLMEGQQVRLRVSPDGATELIDDSDLSDRPELRAAFEPMPATLPRNRVTPGDSWTRSMALPLAGGGTTSRPTTITATFHLDSLSGAGDLAYISMHGAVTRDADAEGLPAGTKFVTTGVVRGTMVVDRRRAWIVDTHTMMTLKSTVTPPPGGGEPMHMTMKYTQWLRVEP